MVNAWFFYQLPIHLAVRAGHAEVVKLLLEQGANPGNDWEQRASDASLLKTTLAVQP